MILNNIERIYEHIDDELSKDIFGNRLLYSLTKDSRYITSIVENMKWGRELLHDMSDDEDGLILFGAGTWGKDILRSYSNLNWKGVIDNNYKGFFEEGAVRLRVCPLSETKILSHQKVVISSRLFHDDIKKQLLEAGVNEDRIINAGSIIDKMSQRQYFDLSEMELSENEVFVDAGSFDGLTSIYFSHFSKGRYKKIYAFEPDEKNLKKCCNTFQEKQLSNVEIFPIGLWNTKDTLFFDTKGNGASKIDNEANDTINVNRLDEMIPHERVTFIKMDLEGAEYNALLGSKKIISCYKPKLAISIYHKPEDIWELPELLLSFCEEYRFFLRHYSISESETVLYAIPKSH